ncbi:MAG TPA: AAA family ATPase [Pseudonocardiaceae bacterium]
MPNEQVGGEPEPVDRKNVRFTHIRLANWRNFVRLDTALQERMFLVGPNASGKSNFLDCFRFLAEIVSIGGGFEAAVNHRGGVQMIRSLSAGNEPAVSVLFARMQRRSGRQIIVSSHSPQLLGDPGIGNDEILVLLPSSEGSVARLFADMDELCNMRTAGLDVGEILQRFTSPEKPINSACLRADP